MAPKLLKSLDSKSHLGAHRWPVCRHYGPSIGAFLEIRPNRASKTKPLDAFRAAPFPIRIRQLKAGTAMKRLAAALALIAAVPALAQQADPKPGSIVVTPPGFQLPSGGACANEIARYRAIQQNDFAMGHVAQSVYNQIKVEIASAEKQCSAGHDAEARAAIIASKRRHGYPTDL